MRFPAGIVAPGDARQLVRRRVEDLSKKMLQVVAGRDQVLFEEGQQFGIGGRIVRTEIVRRME
jgi:hypothetical protein